MKIFYFFITIFYILSSNIYAQNKWTGEYKNIDGIPVVINPEKPIYSDPQINLEKVWEIGGEDPGFIFNQIVAVDIDSKKNIYVLDFLEHDIKAFTSNGEHYLTFGQEGQGPGEYLQPNGLTILPDNKVLVIDIGGHQLKFNLSDYNGNYIRSFTSTLKNLKHYTDRESVYFCKYYSHGNVVLFGWSTVEMKQTVRTLWLFNLVKQTAKIIYKTQKIKPETLNQKNNDRQFLEVLWCFDNKGNFYIIKDTYDYDIEVYDSNGKLLRHVKRDFHFPITSKSEYKRDQAFGKKYIEFHRTLGSKKQWEALKYEPIIYYKNVVTKSIFCDDQNRLWVLTKEPFLQKKSKGILSWFKRSGGGQKEIPWQFTFDVFDSEGRFLMKVPFKAIKPRCFVYDNGYLYYAAQKDDGFPWLFKYKIVDQRY